MARRLVSHLVKVVCDLEKNGKLDPSSEEIATAYLGADKPVPASLVNEVQGKLKLIAKMLRREEYGKTVVLLSRVPYYVGIKGEDPLRNVERMIGEEEAGQCLTSSGGRHKSAFGLKIIDRLDDPIYVASLRIRAKQSGGNEGAFLHIIHGHPEQESLLNDNHTYIQKRASLPVVEPKEVETKKQTPQINDQNPPPSLRKTQ